jgi:hypothetical protein
MTISAMQPRELSQHPLLSAAECEELRGRVMALREHWVGRGEGFFSLATAAYLDAADSHARYLQQASLTNPILRENFADVYEVLRAFLDDRLPEAVAVTSALALPGFHIFDFDGRPCDLDRPADRAHFDLQWISALPGRAPTATLSFTVAIEHPTGGAALEVWPLSYDEASRLDGPVGDYAGSHGSRRVAYRSGCVTVHDGHILHAIGSSDSPRPLGRRITLQGHGALLDGAWVLYW